ncbi:MAG: PQQ-binding-like beta-propeller repeat protein [Litoreibacter sp.]|nr:PQQ-binding-like beta-propeller repeat protein [Litoreibacter sp.]
MTRNKARLGLGSTYRAPEPGHRPREEGAESLHILVKTLVGASLLALSACGERELVLDGERFDVRQTAPPSSATELATRAFVAPAPVNYSSWTHRGGDASRNVTHPALATSLTQVFSVDIGAGNGRKQRLTADPVVGNARIFTLDSASRVAATSTSGSAIWSKDLIPASDKDRDASGGGLALGPDAVYATTGFGELFSLDPETGATMWRQKLEAPVTSAPTYSDGLVYVVTRDSRAWAIDAANGRIRWQLTGAPSEATLIGGSGPLVAGRVAIVPFGSGELVAALKRSGLRVWGSAVAGQRRGRAYANIFDITGDPVFYDGTVYAANAGGRVVAISPASGQRIWSANEGAYSPPLPVGDSLFMISEQGQLLRLDRETGERIWAERLPYFENRKVRRRQAVYAHFGPVLAGGRLLVASNDGLIRSYDPADGTLLGTTPLRGGAASNPVIVDGTLYIVTENGQLTAFR